MSCDRSLGGLPVLPLTASATSARIPYTVPGATDPTVAGIVIPGLAIAATPACAGGGAPATDQYVAGDSHTTPSAVTPGSYSVSAQVSKTNTNGTPGVRQLTGLNIQQPLAPSLVDSWAEVSE
jgi:hypothetical protein